MSPGLTALVAAASRWTWCRFSRRTSSPVRFGDLRLVDSETGAKQEVTFGRFRLKAYQQTVQNFCSACASSARRAGINFFTRRPNTACRTSAQATAQSGGVGMRVDMNFLAPPAFLFAAADSGGDRVLPAQAQAGGEAGFEHVALAEVPGRNPGQRAVPEAAQELAADPANLLLLLAVLALARPYLSGNIVEGRPK